MQVAQQAEPGHIGTGVDGITPEDFSGILIERRHGLFRLGQRLLRRLSYAGGSADQTHAQLFRQNELIPLPGTHIRPDPVRVDSAHDGQAVLHPVICNGVAAHQTASGLSHLLRAPLQDASQNVQIHLVRKADDVQRGSDFAAHGVDIAQSIGCGDLAENVGVLHHRREEI